MVAILAGPGSVRSMVETAGTIRVRSTVGHGDTSRGRTPDGSGGTIRGGTMNGSVGPRAGKTPGTTTNDRRTETSDTRPHEDRTVSRTSTGGRAGGSVTKGIDGFESVMFDPKRADGRGRTVETASNVEAAGAIGHGRTIEFASGRSRRGGENRRIVTHTDPVRKNHTGTAGAGDVSRWNDSPSHRSENAVAKDSVDGAGTTHDTVVRRRTTTERMNDSVDAVTTTESMNDSVDAVTTTETKNGSVDTMTTVATVKAVGIRRPIRAHNRAVNLGTVAAGKDTNAVDRSVTSSGADGSDTTRRVDGTNPSGDGSIGGRPRRANPASAAGDRRTTRLTRRDGLDIRIRDTDLPVVAGRE